MPKILITGDRRWDCDQLATRIVARLLARYRGSTLVIVHGDASGVDSAFERAASAAGIATDRHPARWRELGPKAGPIRNAEMVNAGATFALAVHRNLAWSKGTRGCVRLCLAAGIPVYLIDGEDAEPRRIREA